MREKRVLTFLALWLMALAPVLAQGRGRIEGAITQQGGRGVGGVTVVLSELGLAEITGGNGTFFFDDVTPGIYTVTLTLGEQSDSLTGVEVKAGETTKLDRAVDWDVSFADTITVFSASRQRERIVDAPAAVTIVTEQEIEREASHGQLPKLLEFTPGAEVTQSGLYDFNFNTRGFNSSLNRRVATLIDGRDPSVPFLGSQEWSATSFPLDDLGSLELLRGPSAALYGSNASSGVLNMITKTPRASQGGLVRLTGGELSTFNADLRWAGDLGSDWYFKILGGLRNSGDFTASRVGRAEYAVPCTATLTSGCLPQERVSPDPLDDNQIYFGGLRFDKYFSGGQALTLEGGTAHVEGPVFQTGIGRVQQVDIERPWVRLNFGAERWNFLAYYNKRDAPEQTALASGLNLALDSDNYRLELQGNWEFGSGKGRLVAGGSYEDENIDSLDPRTGRQTLVFEPVGSESEAVFGQFDWSFSDRFKVVLAARWDDSTLHDAQISPKASLVYSINPNNTLRLTYNEAFQVANYSEFFLQAQVGAVNLSALEFAICRPLGLTCGLGLTPALALGNKDLELEEVKTYEIGYSGILGTKAFLTVDYYNSDNENFITDLLPQLGTSLGRINPNFGPWQPQTTLPAPIVQAIRNLVPLLSNNLDGSNIIAAVSYTNFGQVDTQGVDVGLNVYFTPEWRFDFSYSWFDFDINSQDPRLQTILLPNSPENKFNVGVSYVGERWDGSISYRWVDDFLWFVGPFQGTVESYSTVDLVANYTLNDHWSIGINVANALDDEHWESFGGDLLGRRALGNVTFKW